MSIPVTIESLVKAFGSTRAVDGVNLSIAPGDLFFLLGPSGCGKTTLLRMLAGFTDPTSGRIRFGDRDVTHLPPNKRNCGMVFQGYALWPHMTVRQNVAFGLSVRKVPTDELNRRVDAALSTVQMLKLADRKPNQLSGGQQQRVALARAIVIEPSLLLLDEPLSNLDAKLRLEMRSEIKRVCKSADITAVYVTHDQKEALSMADGVAVLREGRVMQVGSPRQLYDRPANRFVADFLGETNFIPATVVGRDGPHAVLDTAVGPLRSAVFPADLPSAGNVTLSIRPEAVRLVHSGVANGDNAFTATRTDWVYLGEMAQHRLAIAGGAVIKVFELNPRPIVAGQDQVRVRVEPGDVVILSD